MMAAQAPASDLASAMRPVALRLLGEPNSTLSRGNDLRWGRKGSLSIDLSKGAFFDNEANVGGGVIDLVMREQHCDQRDALDWLRREGFLEQQATPPRSSRVSTFYDYADADGAIAYRVERRGKGMSPPFLQHGPDGKGGFHAATGCMSGVPRLPYRLPELIAAEPNAIVFIAEGEKDADRLASLGLVATTNSEGAGKFRAELAQHFAGRRVIILPDNDDAGRKHGEDVLGKLKDVAAAVAVLELPDLPDKGDVSDWFDRGGSRDRLAEMAEAVVASGADLLPICDLAAWANQDPAPKAFAIAGYIPERELTLASGVGGANKSLFGQQLATCFAAEHDMLGVALSGGVAMYVTAEDDERELHWRQAHICKAVGLEMASLSGRLILTSLRGHLENQLATFNDTRLVLTAAFSRLGRSIAASRAKLVILDNVAHLFAGNENDRVHVTAFVNALYALCNEHGCAIVLVAHPNKAGDDYSGSTAWLNAVRSHIVIRRPEGAIDPDERELISAKANYARTGQQLAFRWHDFALVRDEDLPEDKLAAIADAAQASGENAAFLACLAERNRPGRFVSPNPGPTYAPAQFEGMPQAKRFKRDQLKRAMERLFTIGAIETAEHRNTDKGRTITILRAVPRTPNPTPEPFPNTLPEHPRSTLPNTPPNTLPPKGGTGAASGAVAPVPKSEHRNGHSVASSTTAGMILAPGETGDDVDI